MKNVTKEVFLDAIVCPTLGWMLRSDATGAQRPLTLGERFRIEQGQEIGRRARGLYQGGLLIAQRDMTVAVEDTRLAMSDPSVPAVFEAAFLVDGCAARADILERTEDGWHLIEVKSAVNDREEFIDDMAYTLMVAGRCGVDVSCVSLMLVSRDFRLGMPDTDLFAVIDHTEDVRQRAGEFEPLWREIEEATGAPERREPELIFECRRCEVFDACLGEGIDNHIFDLPRLSRPRFEELRGLGVVCIRDIPAALSLTDNQSRVRDCVVSNRSFVRESLAAELASVSWPAYYLDFETVMTAIPLYPGVAPYEQLPTQYSVHLCSGVGAVVGHREYLADPSRDCRRELAQKLLEDLGDGGSIIVYSSFERAVINSLARLCPELAAGLGALAERLVDLEAIIRRGYYHPGFRGSTSIKKTLPVLVPEMSYNGLEIREGESAAAAFARMALGVCSHPDEVAACRRNLIEYCQQDTEAMLRLHGRLNGIAGQR